MIFINGFMQNTFDKSEGNGNGIEPFFPVTFNPVPPFLADGFLCSTEHGKLCFEALETELVPQNNLPYWELEKRLPKSAFCVDLKWISDEREQ
ncbi:hypothetical protein N180_08460 [Pedobacter antarcticus 4BY]|uniref:Uncharacterized protein n=2 Tax=Pedobacter antarcticus TaxID=34086 RepID=A0A081PK85_9SPHI|nr:hypothetical protein [Pedobacter antarcticus]KEQ31108.1 hypothetical protein N180_08460 [Pedobacter antarcticus 4BY]